MPPAVRRSPLASLFALAAYAALVAVPLLVLFFRVGRTAAGSTAGSTPGGVRSPVESAAPALDLPPFDAYGAADAPAFPDIELYPVDGGAPVPLGTLVAGPAIIHLWSLACRSCADEWDAFARFQREAAASGLPGVVSVLVVPEGDADPAAVARERLGAARREGWFGRRVPALEAPWVVAENRVLARGDRPTADRPITGYPETFLLDGRRRVRLRLAGPMPWDLETWRRLLRVVPDLP